jgi:ATP phosphoribosyltransferase
MLKIALPKGSLERATLALFEDADLAVNRSSERDYRASIADPRISEVRILRPQEIPRYVAKGYFDLGITGRDWIEETGSDVVSLTQLHYSKATARPVNIVVAVPGDSAVESVTDLKPGTRVSTEFPELTRRFFESKLVANKEAYADPEKRHAMEQLSTLLLGTLEARGRVLVKLNVPAEKLDAVIAILPSMKSPTVSKLFGDDAYAVETVVPKSDINVLIPALKDHGATDIIELPISKIVH